MHWLIEDFRQWDNEVIMNSTQSFFFRRRNHSTNEVHKNVTLETADAYRPIIIPRAKST